MTKSSDNQKRIFNAVLSKMKKEGKHKMRSENMKKYCHGEMPSKDIGVVGEGVEIKTSKIPNAGNGLFATRTFKKGERITEYCGKEIWKDTFNRKGSKPVSHIVTRRDGYLIDGLKDPERAKENRLGGASFANDTRTRYNNAMLQRFVNPTNKTTNKVYIVALRTIGPSEEIFVNYGQDYWK